MGTRRKSHLYGIEPEFNMEKIMSKKRKIDFVLEESDTAKLIFRFYPRRSSCHSFGDEPPKDWSDVYKVYYSY